MWRRGGDFDRWTKMVENMTNGDAVGGVVRQIRGDARAAKAAVAAAQAAAAGRKDKERRLKCRYQRKMTPAEMLMRN
jgi:hypothetical protein